jgi:superfamily II DNA or RNA helicase
MRSNKNLLFIFIPFKAIITATGSGKTVMMAGLILYLYEQGYRNFLFFVNRGQIVEKTKDNFINPFSSKYLSLWLRLSATKG